MLKCCNKLVSNLWTSEQPLVNIATGKEVPQEMVKNVISLKQIGENAMNEIIARFTFQEKNSSQNTYYDSIKKPEVESFTVTTKCQQLQKMKKNLSVKLLHASITKRSICPR